MIGACGAVRTVMVASRESAMVLGLFITLQ